ncbi:MAG: asparaginase [Hyphomicrobiales bacterium]|nr:asparaginase [Hyphomicrobiales bacterium]MCP5371168.1 asparaginase [Hyphomicrobiales bacterium]
MCPDDVHGAGGANPVLVEVTRGGAVESRHRGAAAVVRADGTVAAAWGDIGAAVFPRSAIKSVQALPLVETGAADTFDVSDAELALACASHAGEPEHVERVAAWLARLGLGPDDLACGPQWPRRDADAHAMARAGQTPSPLHNNCSGKHTGFLATALHKGEPTRGYAEPTHPVQQRVLGVFEQMSGTDLGAAPCGIDGCSAPTWAMPLGNLALAMARLAAPDDLPPARARAARRVFAAMTAHPYLVAGTDRYCTTVMQAGAGALMVKTGAEGVYCAALPAHGLGIALKCDDGATRAAEVTMTALLLHLDLAAGALKARLEALARPDITNWRGVAVGDVRTAGPLA